MNFNRDCLHDHSNNPARQWDKPYCIQKVYIWFDLKFRRHASGALFDGALFPHGKSQRVQDIRASIACSDSHCHEKCTDCRRKDRQTWYGKTNAVHIELVGPVRTERPHIHTGVTEICLNGAEGPLMLERSSFLSCKNRTVRVLRSLLYLHFRELEAFNITVMCNISL